MTALKRAIVGLFLALSAAAAAHAGADYVPERVFDTARGQFSDFEAMLADLAKADIVFVGEQHDDPNTHRLELALLEGFARRRGDLIVALEMFERDVQEPLDHFLMGHTSEDEFLTRSRPWPQYATAYKPLVDFAAAKEWPVVASNVPRALAADVSKRGLDGLKGRSDAENKWFASELQCPVGDEYFQRFVEAMGEHPAVSGPAAPDAEKRLSLERFYFAQCLKDETMAESVARAWQVGAMGDRRPLVVHVNGAFHSDFGEGTAARAKRRLPGKRVLTLTIAPIGDLDALAPDANERRRADYLVYTIATSRPRAATASPRRRRP